VTNPQSPSNSGEATKEGRRGITLGQRVRNPAWLGRVSAVGFCVTVVVFVGTFVFAFMNLDQFALLTVPAWLQAVLALPYIIAVFGLGTVAGAVSGWRHSHWSLSVRIHHTALAVLAILFVWQLTVLGFLP
jgi:hypothetical protein